MAVLSSPTFQQLNIMDGDMRIDPQRAKQLGENLANVVQRIQGVKKSNRPVRTDPVSPLELAETLLFRFA